MIDARKIAAFGLALTVLAGGATCAFAASDAADDPVVSTARSGSGAVDTSAPQTPVAAPAPTKTPPARHADSIDADFMAAASRASDNTALRTGGQVTAAVGTGGYRYGSVDLYAVKPGAYTVDVHVGTVRGRGFPFYGGFYGVPYYAAPAYSWSPALAARSWSGARPIDRSDTVTDEPDMPLDTSTTVAPVTPPTPPTSGG
jgi:hypothetical protein